MLSIPISIGCREAVAVDVEVDESRKVQTEVVQKTQGLKNKSLTVCSRRMQLVDLTHGNLGSDHSSVPVRSVCLLFKIFFATTQKYILNKGTPLRSHARELVCCSFIIQTRHVLKRRLLKRVFVFLGEVHRALCINIMPHSAPSIGISSALNFYIP